MSLLSRYVTRNVHGVSWIRSWALSASNCTRNSKRDQGVAWGTQHQRVVSSSALDEVAPVTNATKMGRAPSRMVSTLNPGSLGLQDLFDISGLHNVNFVLPSEHSRYPPQPRRTYITYTGSTAAGRPIPFPEGTRGFLYFRRSEYSHAAAGEIRFRVIRAEDSDLPAAESFSRGSDLLHSNSFTPWRIHLIHVGQQYPAIKDSLVKEELVTPTQVAEIERLTSGISIGSRRILEDVRAPFLIDLGNPEPELVILHEASMFWGKVYLYFCTPMKQARASHPPTGSPSGKALVRFEVINSQPVATSKNTTPRVRLVLRVLEIVEPPKPEDAKLASQIFKEGQLVQAYNVNSQSTTGPWFPKNPSRFITPHSMRVLEETYLKTS